MDCKKWLWQPFLFFLALLKKRIDMTNNKSERITFRCTKEEKKALQERAGQCAIGVAAYCRTLSLGGRPRATYTDEEKALLAQLAKLNGSLTRLANYFSRGQYQDVAEENRLLIIELKKLLKR